MKTFVQIVLVLTQISLVITTIQVYLRINKIWKRKHEKEVADSQSIAGLTLLFLNCVLWGLYYIYVEDDLISMLDTSLYLFETFVFLLISTGLWVKGAEGKSLWELMQKALNLERKEANYLIKRFFKPTNAEAILGILHQLAMIDDEMDPKEREMLEMFAKEWKIDYNPDKFNKYRRADSKENYIRLRKSVQDYINIEPQREQAAQLKDMMTELIHADEKISPQEELIIDELQGMIEDYLHQENGKRYNVLIVPQKSSHDMLIRDLVPDAKKFHTAGGEAYSIGTYYSLKYAEMITRQYREIHLFTIVHNPEETEASR